MINFIFSSMKETKFNNYYYLKAKNIYPPSCTIMPMFSCIKSYLMAITILKASVSKRKEATDVNDVKANKVIRF